MCMGGPTASEEQIQSQQQAYSKEIQQNYSKVFGEQQDVLQKLQNIETPIAQAGPSQQGWSPAEAAAVNTQILNTTGANYANAVRAAGGAMAGRGGGAADSAGLISGPERQIKAGIAAQAAGQTSGEELQSTLANYATGRQNWAQATGGLQALSGEYAPTAYAGAGTQASGEAFSQAKTIEEQQAASDAALAGMITTGVTDIASGGAGALGGGGMKGLLGGLGG